jgi:beta-glucanase (GH16 family)
MRGLFINLALIILLASGGNTAFGQLLWSDEFDTGASLDASIWSYDLGDSGWGNRELQNYTDDPQNVRLEDGNLVINIRSTGEGASSQFTSARVRTQDKLTFKYGRIEARIKMPDLADGLWPAFWTLGNNFSQVGWPFCGELDVVEMGSGAAIGAGRVNQRVGSTAHWDNDGQYASYGRSLDTSSDLNDDYHIFSMDWTPETVTTYIDGQQIWTMRIRLDQCASCDEFHKPHFAILNVAVGGNYTGLLNPGQITAQTPAEMLVDYVRIYDNGFTKMGGSFIEDQPIPGQEFTGSWYNENQSGHGFSIAFGQLQNGVPIAAVYWYTYDSDGNPIFLVGSGVLNGSVLELELDSPSGMKYGEFDPDSVVRESAGSVRFDFADSQNATFSYSPSEFSVQNWGHTSIENLPLSRLFTVPVTDSSTSTE